MSYNYYVTVIFKVISFRGQIKLDPRQDWSLIGALFKISDEHPRHFGLQNTWLKFYRLQVSNMPSKLIGAGLLLGR